jgi:hypothetical protein
MHLHYVQSIKLKSKVACIDTMKAYGEEQVLIHPFLASVKTEVSVYLQTLPFLWWMGSWVGLRSGPDGLTFAGDRIGFPRFHSLTA